MYLSLNIHSEHYLEVVVDGHAELALNLLEAALEKAQPLQGLVHLTQPLQLKK